MEIFREQSTGVTSSVKCLLIYLLLMTKEKIKIE